MPRLQEIGRCMGVGLIGLAGFSGCAGYSQLANHSQHATPPKADFDLQHSSVEKISLAQVYDASKKETASKVSGDAPIRADDVELVTHLSNVVPATIELQASDPAPKLLTPRPVVIDEAFPADEEANIESPSFVTNALPLNLPTALAMVDSRHPVVGFAQWRVQEAYAELARAEALWLPSIQAGFSFHRHDGNYQASNGAIVDVNRNSFQYGFGTGATGAGTTASRPGLIAQFHLADAIFQPAIAERTAWARGHAVTADLNGQLLQVSLAYVALLEAHQTNRILEASRTKYEELSKITRDYAEAGEGLQADADRLQTEVRMVDNRLMIARELTAVASARLSEALSLDANVEITPMDYAAVPLQLMSDGGDKGSMIGMALATRPELKESQALVAAACNAYQREKYAPFVPSVLLGFSTGGFGGGLGSSLNKVDSRYDFDALMSWELRNLGLGEKAARRASSARVQQAKFEKLRIMDQVAREASEAYQLVRLRRNRMTVTQDAVATAEESHRLNLERIRDGQGLPLEVLQSVQALEAARLAYLNAVIDQNEAELQLQWAMGWPIEGSGGSTGRMSPVPIGR